jgi:hypothetical protein
LGEFSFTAAHLPSPFKGIARGVGRAKNRSMDSSSNGPLRPKTHKVAGAAVDAASLSPLPASAVNLPKQQAGSPPRLLDRVREAVRVRHFAIRPEQAYVQWARRLIAFRGKRHPQEMGAAQVP